MFDLTVIIPTFNRRQKLERALSSVWYQTMSPKKIIVMNDGAPLFGLDTPSDCAKDFIQINNCGRADHSALSMYEGAYLAETEYVSYLLDDDWYDPNFIERAYNEWMLDEAKDDISFFYSQGLIHFNDGVKPNFPQHIPSKNVTRDRFVYTVCELMSLTITPSCCVFRRKDVLENFHIGGFLGMPRSEKALMGQECLMFLLISARYDYVRYCSHKLVNLCGDFESTTMQCIDDPKYRAKYLQARKIFKAIALIDSV